MILQVTIFPLRESSVALIERRTWVDGSNQHEPGVSSGSTVFPRSQSILKPAYTQRVQ